VHYKDFSIFLQITSLLHKLLEVLFRYQSFFLSKDDISQFHDRDHGKSSKFLGFIVFEPFFYRRWYQTNSINDSQYLSIYSDKRYGQEISKY
jgi:hypothetical protein